MTGVFASKKRSSIKVLACALVTKLADRQRRVTGPKPMYRMEPVVSSQQSSEKACA